MGYRSEVVLAVSKDLMPHFLTVLAKEPEVRTLVFQHYSTLNEDWDGEGTFLVAWKEIKWYPNRAPIAAIEGFIEACEDNLIKGFDTEDQGDHMRFVRLGEDNDDYQEKGTFHDWDIFMNRTLSYAMRPSSHSVLGLDKRGGTWYSGGRD
tara:strand:- start:1099 stop:1548 length:450 start_codon:yes stop_codon:yes gene_type:complete